MPTDTPREEELAKTWWYTCKGIAGRVDWYAFGRKTVRPEAEAVILADLAARGVSAAGFQAWRFYKAEDLLDRRRL